MSYCPECEAVINEEFEDIGEIISCPECGVELEVIAVDPVELDLALVDDEDDEFSFDDDDDPITEKWTILIYAGTYAEAVTLGTNANGVDLVNVDLVGVDRDAVII